MRRRDTPQAPWARGCALMAVGVVALGLAPAVDAQPPGVTVTASKTSIYYRGHSTITGTAAPGARVELRADRSPFGRRMRTVRSGLAGADGSYLFTVAPTANTRLRVCFAGPRGPCSPILEVLVYTLVVKRFTFLHPDLIHFQIFFEAPRDHPYAGRKIFFYYGRRGAPRLHVVAARRVRRVRPTIAKAEADVRVPANDPGLVTYCVQPKVYRVKLGRTVKRKRDRCPRSFPRDQRPLG